ncbi:hypothetical protein pEaSNUABM40_00145 [Erwinia phage pEa_SNUABM_40]|uniref:KTSC and Metallopeptidase-like N-terminal fusion domain-containing protein n=1 Tax=Erwinia phage pEa_SNUABM_3 TaxID=2869552 RepID=A0AAE7XJ21_9CAUD|nr:hypothetical protein MPK68_gp144 [Erwinia phage pEa_SNUABM_3]QZE56680.1 hypothetical protein pEaSNUABM20_00144 [Erwinia phage pEa_SNUABM_20]QZE58361.1 hypothetical protein pEaSNUABM40_00145 [Erwinia phage pEa_SNUABM_40]UAW52925.1 hypothetical protein pEaSNUABM23_00143 [Erwinia phage pEa_SNUABM_23]UIW10821.1 hypothetical protein pEaSNUABM23_00143 [Erwinia phage pEa_SNUABM_31]QZE56341.1 hypothetical protein pEaSNUABM3_00144 [Erwinia phage pEa_SNUABM_3]
MAEGLSILDYSYYRYLGNDTMISNGIRMQPREVVGLLQVNSDLYYIAHPKYDRAAAISGVDGDMIATTSRPFTAKPDALFKPDFNFTPYEEEKKASKPKAKPTVVKKPAPEPLPPSKVNVPLDKLPPMPVAGDDDTTDSMKARQVQRLGEVDFGNMKALRYASAVYPGGTPNNYAVKPVKKCGRVHLEVKGMDELRVPGISFEKNGVSPPDYVLKDIQENVMPGVGLNIALPFDRLYVGVLKANSDSGGSHIATYRVHGFLYGAISIHPAQLVQLLGGYNSLSMAHVITHELAHFVDDTMLRNVDRMKFDQAIRGKKIHPDSLTARTIKTVPTEHFATLAELMVWGYSLRNVYTLNGVEVVSKYFENRYIPQADIDSRKI